LCKNTKNIFSLSFFVVFFILSVVCRLQSLRLGACNLYGLFAFAHDTKDGSKFIFCWLVSLVRVSWFVLAGVVTCMPWTLCPWFVWLVCLGWCGYLHALNLVSLLVCPWLKWLPACLEPRALLVRVLGWSGYLHTLNLVSLVCVSWLVWLPAYLEPRVPGSCVLVGVVTCIPWTSCPWFVLVGVSLVRVLGWCGYLEPCVLSSCGYLETRVLAGSCAPLERYYKFYLYK